MAQTKQSEGTCAYCNTVVGKRGIMRHLGTCAQRQAAIAIAEEKTGDRQTLYHLRVRDIDNGDYWLELEMPGSATLKQLDHYLRGIWLECCGHLSEFTTKGWHGSKIPMSWTVEDVFETGVEITHIYDFGTSSVTLVKMAGAREGKPTTKRPVALMARNLTPEAKCIECEGPAAWLCIECLIEENQWGALCDEHAKTHPHENYGEPIPLVNSPRLGMCGYTGPADPPY